MLRSLIPDTSFSVLFSQVLDYVWRFLPLWLPILLLVTFVQTWLKYVRTKWNSEQQYVLLEMRIPQEVQKSPAAMEVVISALHQVGTGSLLDVYLKGRTRPWFSLELVSLGGQIHFYIWTPVKLKNIIESQVYSQFPTVEIYEVPDYSLDVVYNPSEITVWGAQLGLTKADVYPIKTYIDYGLDQNPDEEFKIDPITAVLEYLGSLREGEQAWIQILVQAHKSEGLKELHIFKIGDWTKSADAEIKKIIGGAAFKPPEGQTATSSHLTEGQKQTISAIERSVGKYAFDTAIRMLYIARKDVFNPTNIGGLLGSFKQFSSVDLNGFKPAWNTNYDYPWQDFRGSRKAGNDRKVIDAYKRRSFFHPPYKNFHGKPFILTTEELATLFHFPGGVATTPTLPRLVSKKAEPPANLPL